jgi:uncharacterized protein with ATP-grasp and redox domains
MNDRIDLPPYLMTSEPGSFARSTITERKPQIIRQVVAENTYPPAIVANLVAFADEIAEQPLQPLYEQAADVAAWNHAWQEHAGKTWLELPWYFAEAYFYRRLLEAVRYLQPGPWQHHDPFGVQKQRQEAQALRQLAAGWAGLPTAAPDLVFESLLHSALWGNRADLSNFTLQARAQAGLAARDERHLLLIDHTPLVHGFLRRQVKRLAIITDNVGLDLLFDLALADFLLQQGWVGEVVYHLKDRPFFVSDAMPGDAERAIELLRTDEESELAGLGQRLAEAVRSGAIRLRTDPFWSSFRMFPDLPDHLRAELATADLSIFKGDVNYRRLLDDRRWPHTTAFESLAERFRLPRPFLVLRTLKGETMVGLGPGQSEQLAAADPTWLINGKRGVIQAVGLSASPARR